LTNIQVVEKRTKETESPLPSTAQGFLFAKQDKSKVAAKFKSFF